MLFLVTALKEEPLAWKNASGFSLQCLFCTKSLLNWRTEATNLPQLAEVPQAMQRANLPATRKISRFNLTQNAKFATIKSLLNNLARNFR